ncbi:MAG: MarR family winged helix-turn-helix transcriptional regulator [Lysobacteraceae bacterium]
MDPVPRQPSLPTLLRFARARCVAEVRRALEAAGFGDIPGNGVFVVGAVARGGVPLSDIVRDLGVSKQAAGQLVDLLVTRGYLDRQVDPTDRRRLTVVPSERGLAAAAAARAAGGRIEAELARRLPPEWIEHTRAALQALAGMDQGASDEPRHG